MHNTSKAAIQAPVVSLIGSTNINYVVYKSCVCTSGADRWKQWEYSEIEALTKRKEMAYGAGLNRLRRETDNGVWLTAILQHLNSTELLRMEFQDNIILQYVIVTLNLPTESDGWGNNFLVLHAI